MTIKSRKVGGKARFNSLNSDFLNIFHAWIQYFCSFKISNLHEMWFDYVNPFIQLLTLSGHDKIITLVNSHQVLLPAKDLYKIKPVNSQLEKGRGSKSSCLAQELLTVVIPSLNKWSLPGRGGRSKNGAFH